MKKKIKDWQIMIPATPDREREVDFMNTFLHYANGEKKEINFNARLVGYSDDWMETIQTSVIKHYVGNDDNMSFTTHSGSIYEASMDDFKGFMCRTIRGDVVVMPPTA